MTEKDLKKLSRVELLELFLEQCRRNEALEKELEEVKAKLESKEIQIQKSGSIAEASLALTSIFEEAQKAADLYLRNVSGAELKIEQKTENKAPAQAERRIAPEKQEIETNAAEPVSKEIDAKELAAKEREETKPAKTQAADAEDPLEEDIRKWMEQHKLPDVQDTVVVELSEEDLSSMNTDSEAETNSGKSLGQMRARVNRAAVEQQMRRINRPSSMKKPRQVKPVLSRNTRKIF